MSAVAEHEHENESTGLMDDPESFPILYAAIVGTILMIVCVVMLAWLYNDYEAGLVKTKVYDSTWVATEKLAAEQEEVLATGQWRDGNTPIVGIPIAEAMKLVVRDGAAQKAVPGSAPAIPAPAAVK